MADCRLCRFFVARLDMDPRDRRWAEAWVEYRRPGQTLLGLCLAYNRPVTYYRGRCSRYAEKSKPRPRPLDEFFR